MSGTLFDLVKGKLNITWSDEDTDAEINRIIEDGHVEMRRKLGTPDDYDFSIEGQERKLFLSWCLYEWNHASNEFDSNYLNDIMQIRQKYEVMEYAQANGV